jgi:hypothetical protein
MVISRIRPLLCRVQIKWIVHEIQHDYHTQPHGRPVDSDWDRAWRLMQRTYGATGTSAAYRIVPYRTVLYTVYACTFARKNSGDMRNQ